jgi:hypothetical protein
MAVPGTHGTIQEYLRVHALQFSSPSACPRARASIPEWDGADRPNTALLENKNSVKGPACLGDFRPPDLSPHGTKLSTLNGIGSAGCGLRA